MQELRQSTEIKVRVGSAVDATDGVTPETTLALGTADQAELLKHNGAATVDISARTFAAITSVDGWYDLTLTTEDTNTLGQVTVVIQDSSLMAPIFKDFMVVIANYWDSKYSSDTRQVDVIQWLGTAAATPNVAGFPKVDLTYILGSSVVTGTAQLGVNVVTEENIDFGALKKTSLNASTPTSITTVTGNVDGNVGGSVGSLTGHTNQTGDSYPIVSHVDHGNAKLVRSTTPANALDVSATGEAGLDFDNVKDAAGAHTLTNITVPTVTTTATATNLTNAPTNGDLTVTMKTSVNTEVKDVLTVDTIADSYVADGSQPTIAQAILAIQQMMQEKSITGTTLTVKKPDGSTTAMTFTLDSATVPTSVTRAT